MPASPDAALVKSSAASKRCAAAGAPEGRPIAAGMPMTFPTDDRKLTDAPGLGVPGDIQETRSSRFPDAPDKYI